MTTITCPEAPAENVAEHAAQQRHPESERSELRRELLRRILDSEQRRQAQRLAKR